MRQEDMSARCWWIPWEYLLNVYLSELQLHRHLVRIISVYIQVLTFLMRRIRWRACGLHGKEHLNLS